MGVALSERAALVERAQADRRRLVAIAQRVLGDAEEAEDVAQEVLIRLTSAAEEPRSLPAWLTTVCYRLALDALRRRERVAPRGEPQAVSLSREPSPAEAAARAEEGRRALEALDALEDPYREALSQRYREGRSFAEIARLMSAKERTVRTWVGRGLSRLRQTLGAR
jgi:RNA polymerase sigma factor (sigma-70 family)